MSWRIDRRHLLTGAGAIFTLPLLESMFRKTAWAGNPAGPSRFVSLYMPNGTYNVKGDAVWYPPAGPLTGNLPLVLSPFAGHIGDFSVLMHPSCHARDRASQTAPDGGGHLGAVVSWLSQTAETDFNSPQPTVPGSSFDQMIADTSKKPNLVMSGGCNDANPDNSVFNYADYVSYSGGKPNEPHKNPVELYKLMFASLVPPPPSAPMPAAARNHSILDSSLADINDLKSKLGKTDNQKLDDYFTSVRALETRLYGAPVTPPTSCVPGSPPDASLDNVDLDGSLSNSYIARVQAFFDMIVLAFKCDLVRSVSFMYDGETCQRQNNPCPPALRYGNADLTAVLHTGISHYGQNPGGREKCISRDRMYMSLFFYLLDALKQATDPGGSPILDSTIVLGGFNVIDGQHTGDAEGTPMVVGGGKNFMHPGNCFDLGGADMTDLFYTFSTMLGLGWSSYQGSTTVLKI